MEELNVSDFINSLDYENVKLSSYHGEDNAVSGKYALTEAEIFQNEWEIEDYAPKPKSPSLIDSYYNEDVIAKGTLRKEKDLVDELDKISEKEYGGNVISKDVYCSGEEGSKEVSDSRSPVRSMGIYPEREQEIQHFECRKRSYSPKDSQELLYSRRSRGHGDTASPEMPDIVRSMGISPGREQEIQHFEYRKGSSSPRDSQEPVYSRRSPGHGHSTSPEMPDIVRSMGISPEREQKIGHFEFRLRSSSPDDNHEPLYSCRSPTHRHSASPRDSDSKVDCLRTYTSPTRQTEQNSPQAEEELLYTRRSPRRKHSPSPERSVGGSKILHPQSSTSPWKQPQEDSIIGAEESMYTHRLGRHIYSPSIKLGKDMKRIQSRTSTSPRKRYQQDSFGHKCSPSPQRLERVHSRSSSSPPRMSQQDSPRVQESLYSRRSPKQKRVPSPERSSGDRRRVIMQFSNSPRRLSRHESPKKDDLKRKRLSPSPRVPYSPNHRGQNRSPLRSPTRRRFSLSGYRRDVRNRSRSRSPYPQDRYRKSPRKSSPRRRSPPPLRHHQSYHRFTPRRKPWSPPRNRDTGVGRPGKNLFIAGFNFVTTERDLEKKFSRFGRVTDIRIVRDSRTGDSRGFGFLSLEKDKEADDAIRTLDQTEWNGRVVLVEKSKSR